MPEIVATNAYRAQMAARAASGATSLVPSKMAFGDGSTPEALGDIALDNELFRVDLESISSDGLTLTVAASISWEDTDGNGICEVGVFALDGETEILMGRKVFPLKELVAPDWSQFIITFTY